MTWHEHIEAGNACFDEKYWHEAEEQYHLAMNILDENLRAERICIDKLGAWVCVCHNLGSLYEKMNMHAEALYFFEHPHQVMSALLNEQNQSRLSLELNLKLLNVTSRALVSYQKEHPDVENVFSIPNAEQSPPIFKQTLLKEDLCQKRH